jgi:hypothetical protein
MAATGGPSVKQRARRRITHQRRTKPDIARIIKKSGVAADTTIAVAGHKRIGHQSARDITSANAVAAEIDDIHAP